jgi:hypothetical protein
LNHKRRNGASNTTNNKTTARNKVISGRKAGTTVVQRKVKAGSKRTNPVAKQLQSQTQKINSLADLATTPEAKANVSMLDAFLAESAKSSPYIKAVEFKGVGKRLEILSAEIDRTPFNGSSNKGNNNQQQQQQRRGPRMVFKCRDLDDKDHRERIWTAGQMAVLSIKPLYDSGIRVMRIWSRGVDQNTRYYADKTDLSKTKEQEASEHAKIYDIDNPFLNEEGTEIIAKVEPDNGTSDATDAANAKKLKEYKKGYAKVGKVKVKKKKLRGKQRKK